MKTSTKVAPRPVVNVWFVVVALAGPVAVSAAAAQPAPPRYTIAQFMRTTTYRNGSFFADEKRMLVTSDESGTPNACWVSTDGGPLTPLLPPGNDSTDGLSCFPSDDRIIVMRDQGGNEQNHLFVRELDGTLRDLTPGNKLKATFVRWSKDLKTFYVLTNEREPRKIDLYRYQADDYSRRLVDDDGHVIAEISPDDRFLAVHKWGTATDIECSVVDLTTGTLIPILPHPDRDAKVESASFSPDSQSLLVLTDDDGEFTRIVQVELATGKVTEVEKADWDVQSCRFSPTGRYRITQINQDGSTVVRVFDRQANRGTRLPEEEESGSGVRADPCLPRSPSEA